MFLCLSFVVVFVVVVVVAVFVLFIFLFLIVLFLLFYPNTPMNRKTSACGGDSATDKGTVTLVERLTLNESIAYAV